jgi:hypothetical protein
MLKNGQAWRSSPHPRKNGPRLRKKCNSLFVKWKTKVMTFDLSDLIAFNELSLNERRKFIDLCKKISLAPATPLVPAHQEEKTENPEEVLRELRLAARDSKRKQVNNTRSITIRESLNLTKRKGDPTPPEASG